MKEQLAKLGFGIGCFVLVIGSGVLINKIEELDTERTARKRLIKLQKEAVKEAERIMREG